MSATNSELQACHDALYERTRERDQLRAAIEALVDQYEQAIADVRRPNYAAKIHEAVAHDLRTLLADGGAS